MQVVTVLGPDVHRKALAKARDVVPQGALTKTGLNTLLNPDTISNIESLWDKIEEALDTAYKEGREAAAPLINAVTAAFNSLSSTAHNAAQAARAVILERLSIYQKEMIDGALKRVPSTLSVGTIELPMTSISIDQKIKLSGSLKASLSDICSFVADGELTLSAKYGTASVRA